MLKQLLKKHIYRLGAIRDEKTLLERIMECEVVSFDVFDTAVKRDVLMPEEVFTCVEKALREQGETWSNGFAQARIKAEYTARKAMHEREITLAEIYAQLPYSAVPKRTLMQLECETELAVSTPNLPIKRVYDACVQQGKKVLFISDMYLHAEIVEQILKKNGYTQGKLYVSSESGLTKRSGDLYRYVMETEKADVHNWLHIGDSIKADFLVPRRLGGKAILVDRAPFYNPYYMRQLYRQDKNYQQLNHFINIHITKTEDSFEKIGYAVFGPLLYGFALWLDKMIPADRTIVFLAREGALLQKAFQIVSNRPSVYLYSSRRAITIAQYALLTPEEVVSQGSAVMINKWATPKELAINYGLSEEAAERVFPENMQTAGRRIVTPEENLSVLKRIWPYVCEIYARQNELLQQYAVQLGLSAKCAVVDVGWRGTAQMSLNKLGMKILGESINWEGYYIGIYPKLGGKEYYNNRSFGFLYGKEKDKTQRYISSHIINTIAFFESIFRSTEGSTASYSLASDGTVQPVLDRPDMNAGAAEKVLSMQNAALRFVSDINASPARVLIKAEPRVCIANYLALAKRISNKTLTLISDAGIVGDDGLSLVSAHGLGFYILHPRTFMDEFLNKQCKAWYLKSVFKIPLPYFAMLDIMRKLFYR